jgi:predicted aspartyl protease
MAEKVLNELSILAQGPQSLSLPMGSSGHIFVQVRFGRNGRPHRFLLDTGATHSLITRELLSEISRETEVTEAGKGKGLVADGSTHPFTRYRVKNAFLFHLPLGDIEVQVLDKAHRGAMNLLGMRSIKNIAVSFDNAKKTVEISRRQ